MTAMQPSRSAQARRVSPNYEQAQHLCISAPPSAHRAFVLMVLQNPFSATRLFSHLYKTPGGVGVTAIPGNSIYSQLRDKSEVSSFAATHPKNARLSPCA